MKKLHTFNAESLPEEYYCSVIVDSLWHDPNIGVLLVDSNDMVIASNNACSQILYRSIEPGTTLSDIFEDKLKKTFNNSSDEYKITQKNFLEDQSHLHDFYKKYGLKYDNNVVDESIVFSGIISDHYIVVRQILGINQKYLHKKNSRYLKILIITNENDKFYLKKEVERLQLLNHQLEQIFDASFDQLYVTNGEGKTLKISKSAYQRVYGETPDKLIGRNVKDLESEGRFWPSVFPRILEEKRPITFIQHTNKGRRMLVSSTPIFDENNNIVMVISNSRDITELLNLRERLERVQDMVHKYEEEILTLRQEQLQVDGVVAVSQQMKNVIYAASKAARAESTVLILGPTGVGKGVIAKMIHNLSPRSQGPFVKVNCAAIPESLMEAELFGYESGAFTGARKEGKCGLIEQADGGTLFLDEIAEIPLSMQAKLLDFIQDKTFKHVGGTKSIQINARIITATNRNLLEMVHKNMFRDDLYYRLMVIPIEIPPLKERPDDIFQLARFFLNKFCKSLGVEKAYTPDALDALMNYDWPGNVRELENTIERLVVMSDSHIINLETLPKKIRDAYLGITKGSFEYSEATSSDVNFEEPNYSFVNSWDIKNALERTEERLLKIAFKHFKSTRKIAKALGISQTTVVRKLKKYNIR